MHAASFSSILTEPEFRVSIPATEDGSTQVSYSIILGIFC